MYSGEGEFVRATQLGETCPYRGRCFGYITKKGYKCVVPEEFRLCKTYFRHEHEENSPSTDTGF